MQLLLLLLAFLLTVGAVAEKIIGGHEAKPHSRPYMVYLRFWREDTKRKCSGVLVQKDFVLTAAHCQGSSMNVILGAHDIKQQERTQQRIPVKNAIPHPDYDNRTKLNDIMLLQLQTKARLTAAVRTLSLPVGNSRVSPGQLCSVAGWGWISVNVSTSKLHEVELTIQEDQVCKRRYSKYYKGSELCVGDPKKRMASFKGDSGGPLVCNNMVQGIVAYGKKSGKPPSVFTKLSKNIIGGHEATPHSRPYMAYLQIILPKVQRMCGGALVQEDFVLTAAHCWESIMNVILGAHDIKQQERTQQCIPVKNAIPHPDYDNKTALHDIMVVQLKTKARLTAAVSRLSLPTGNSRVSPGQLCSVAGWGNISVNISTSKLHEVELTIQEDRVCERRYPYYEKSSEMCVGDPKKRMTSFRGDSGGPLVCNGVAHGIASYGNKRGSPPRVFTKISSCLPWIKETMKRLQLQESD
ncbi:mast cell protease 4-like [Rhynchocyon petersi]